jgi:hypothetical protein
VLEKAHKWAIGVTGGLAAPLVAAGAGVILGASAGTFLATAGGVALTTTLFAGAGMGLAGSAMSNRVADLQEFEFKCVAKNPGSLSVLVSVSGWISEDYDFEDQWGSLDDFSERYVIIWEREDLRNVTKSIKDIAVNMGTTFVAKRVLIMQPFSFFPLFTLLCEWVDYRTNISSSSPCSCGAAYVPDGLKTSH